MEVGNNDAIIKREWTVFQATLFLVGACIKLTPISLTSFIFCIHKEVSLSQKCFCLIKTVFRSLTSLGEHSSIMATGCWPTTEHRNPRSYARVSLLKKGKRFFQMITTLLCELKRGFVDCWKIVPLKSITLSNVEISQFFTRCSFPKNICRTSTKIYMRLRPDPRTCVPLKEEGMMVSKSSQTTMSSQADTPKADTPKADTPKADTPKADTPTFAMTPFNPLITKGG
jgi:hypothetical protein